MEIDYYRLLDLNREAMTENREIQLSCYYLIQRTIEDSLFNGVLNEQQKQFLIDLEVLIESEEESQRRNIVGPFNFSTNGSANS
jgi:hypothetical protein